CDPPPGAPRSGLRQGSESGGGPMADFGCHRLEVLLHLLGPVRQVRSLVTNVVLRRDVEDTAVALLQFERGACASVVVTHAAADRQDTLDLFGTRGSIRVASLNSGDIIVRAAGEERCESHPPPANVHAPLVEDFVTAVRAGRDPTRDGRVGPPTAPVPDPHPAATPPLPLTPP